MTPTSPRVNALRECFGDVDELAVEPFDERIAKIVFLVRSTT